jgi:hypothetical protein
MPLPRSQDLGRHVRTRIFKLKQKFGSCQIFWRKALVSRMYVEVIQ